jgi:hypothetical protein
VHAEGYYERNARLYLESTRRLKLVAAMLGLVPIAILMVLISTAIPGGVGQYLWPALSALLLIGWGYCIQRFCLTPITAQDIYERAHADRSLEVAGSSSHPETRKADSTRSS